MYGYSNVNIPKSGNYYIKVYSVSSTYPNVSDISNAQIIIKLDSDYSWISIYRYSNNENNVSIYDKKPLKSLWTYKLEGNVSKYMEFTP
jgi:hypothetical protein